MTRKEFLQIPGVKARLDELATKHGFTVDQILTVIQKESNFKTTAENPKSKATGLIQFIPDTAKGLNTSISEIAEMDAIAQLDLIDRYFEQNHTKGQHPYITVAYPKASSMDMDDIIATPDSIIAKQNPVWQNKDGNVTKRSILRYAGYTEEDAVEEVEETIEESAPKTQTVLGPDGQMIEIEVGEDVTEADLEKTKTGEQKYKSWDDFQENASKFDKSQPFTIGEGAFEKRYKWDKDSERALLIDEDGNYLPEEAQIANQKLQESFRDENIQVPGGEEKAPTPKEKAEELIITPPLVEKKEKKEYSPLEKGIYQDDEGNIWRKGDEGGWQVKYNRAAKGVPEVNEYGEPSFEMKFKYDEDWTTLNRDDKFDEPWTNTEQFESQLTPYSQGVYKGEVRDLPTTSTTTQEGTTVTRGQQLMQGGESLLKGAGKVLDYIGGPGAIISYIMGKKGLKEAMKEVKPQASAKLSPLFMQHLRQTRELSKKGFHPDEARLVRKEIDGAYQKGLENAVRGSAGQRATFLAQSGVLDSQRSSALLDFAAKDANLQRKNADKYEKMMLFKENFDIQRTEKERAEDMERQVANKKAAAGFTSAAFTNLISGFGGSSLTNQYGGGNPFFNQIQDVLNRSGETGTNE